jgi:hypothetical protein
MTRPVHLQDQQTPIGSVPGINVNALESNSVDGDYAKNSLR